MESEALPKKRKKYYQADYLKRPVLRLATLLFLVFQVVKLIRLFGDAVAYKKVNQVTPEAFTLPAVAGALIMIALTAWLLFMLVRQSQGTSRLRSGNRFLVLDFLLVVYGLIRVINQLVLFFQNFELLFLVDVLAIVCALIVPAILLFLADRQRIPPGDVLLLIIGAGAMALSLLGFVMLAISIGKDYTVAHALPELAFRLGLLLMGLDALLTAFKLRAEMPIDLPLTLAAPKMPKSPKLKRELHLKLFDRLPGYDDETPELSLFDEDTEDEPEDEPLYDYGDDDGDDDVEEPEEAPDYVPEPELPPVPAPVVDADGRAVCSHCGRRFPAYLGVCPHCGYSLDGSAPPEPPMPARALAPERPAPRPKSAYEPPPRREGDRRAVCPECGRRFPAYLGVCPHCGSEL